MDFATSLNYAFGIIGVFGTLFGIYAYVKTREAKEPRCCYRTYRNITRLSPGDNPNIKLLYKTEEVNRVFTTYFWFWNGGKKPISKSDVPNNTDIQLALSDKVHNVQVLDCNVVKTSRDAINFAISKFDDNSITMSFDFLDYKDGATIEIQHSGGFDTKFAVNGIILGAPGGVSTRAISADEEEKKAEKAGKIIPKRFARKSTRRRSIEVVVAIAALALGCYGLSLTGGDTDPSRSVSIKRSEFAQVMTAEAPNVSASTVDTIFNRITRSSTQKSIKVPWIVVIAIFMLASAGIVFLLSQRIMFPFPSSLDFDLTQQEAKQMTKSKQIS
jgi:hypothetical protein